MPLTRALHNLYRVRQTKDGRWKVEKSFDNGHFWSCQCLAPDERIARAVANGYVRHDDYPAKLID